MVKFLLVQNVRYEAEGTTKATTGDTKLPITVQTLDTPGIVIAGKMLTKKINIVKPTLRNESVLDDNVCDCEDRTCDCALDLVDSGDLGLLDVASISTLGIRCSSRNSKILW